MRSHFRDLSTNCRDRTCLPSFESLSEEECATTYPICTSWCLRQVYYAGANTVSAFSEHLLLVFTSCWVHRSTYLPIAVSLRVRFTCLIWGTCPISNVMRYFVSFAGKIRRLRLTEALLTAAGSSVRTGQKLFRPQIRSPWTEPLTMSSPDNVFRQ